MTTNCKQKLSMCVCLCVYVGMTQLMSVCLYCDTHSLTLPLSLQWSKSGWERGEIKRIKIRSNWWKSSIQSHPINQSTQFHCSPHLIEWRVCYWPRFHRMQTSSNAIELSLARALHPSYHTFDRYSTCTMYIIARIDILYWVIEQSVWSMLSETFNLCSSINQLSALCVWQCGTESRT